MSPFDAVVVGAGMGGGLAARHLAERGLRVLVLERGRAGARREEGRIDAPHDDPAARAQRGLWPEPVEVHDGGAPRDLWAPLGSGVGGSSVFYAATLERPDARDLDADAAAPHPAGPWPVAYRDLAPWLDRAEALLEVRGEADPLGGPAPPHPPRAPGIADAAILARLRANGRHPYLLHAGVRDLPGCRDCFGRKCPLACKMDGRSAGIEPALLTGRAELWTDAEVLRVVPGPGGVALEVRRGGEALVVRAPRVVLAAGALSTPRLLLASASEAAPAGLGNAGDAVGRHLMLHLNEMFAAWPGVADPQPSKAVGMRDLSVIGGARMGMVQAMGLDADEGVILHHLRGRWARHAWGRSRLAHEAARLPARAAARALGTAKVFVGILEDFPRPANRVVLDPARPGRIVAHYQVPPELEARRRAFRRGIRAAFRGMRPLFLHAEAQPNWGHACGTTRMGADPASSVTDPRGRVWGAPGVWVADAGLFPTSLGLNPSLTVAALALRVAEDVAQDVAKDVAKGVAQDVTGASGR